jgi:hypothetical protein
LIRNPPMGPCPSHHPRNQPTQRKPATPDSPRGFKDSTHTHKRHAALAPVHPTPPHFCLWRTAAHPLLPKEMTFVPYGFVLV